MTSGAAPAAPPARTFQENWADNERMRHVPSLEWVIRKLDEDVRHRIDLVTSALSSAESNDPRRAAVESSLRGVGKSLDMLAETAKHTRVNQPPADLSSRLTWALNHALSSLRSIDSNLFGRRYPVQTFERSKAEPVYSGLASVLCHLDGAIAAVRQVDPTIDEKLYGHLVQLAEPMRREPIA